MSSIGEMSPKEYIQNSGMATDICILLGARIRQLRKRRNWRQIDLAEESGLGRIYISDLERGKKEICLRNLHILAMTFQVRLPDFVSNLDEDEANPDKNNSNH
jgi:transcriptional regulator with XRE-family HTH domain